MTARTFDPFTDSVDRAVYLTVMGEAARAYRYPRSSWCDRCGERPAADGGLCDECEEEEA